MRSICMMPSPCVLGTFGLTWAMTIFAVWIAGRVISTDTPREQYPCLSGGETWMKATSIGKIFFLNNKCISLKKIGIYAPCTEFTAALVLLPAKQLLVIKEIGRAHV